MRPDLPSRLRAALLAADFTYAAVAELIGGEAHDALGRNETTPALRRTTDGSPLATLVRLFLLQVPVPAGDADRALPGLVDELRALDLLEQSGDEVLARLDCRPYAADDRELWIVSDLTPGLDGGPQSVGPEHVLGISAASTSLAQLTLRTPVGSALDLGTGCGVQALHLADHAGQVVATDVNPRALWAARFNAQLNDLPGIEVREGSYFEPVAGERFDLIATNPPFVISPGTGTRLVYRDSGLPGDLVVERIVRAAPHHLNEGGWCQVLANWVVHRDRGWEERIATWLGEDCDALVVQRELVDPAAYVELWLKDSGHHGGPGHRERYDTWLSWLEEQGVQAIGFGWINLRRTGGSGGGVHTLLDWPYDVELPIAPAIEEWGSSVRAGCGADARLVARADVVQETVGPVGAEHPEAIVLRQGRGFRRARTADTVVAGLVGACDGELTVGQVLDALAQLLDLDRDGTRTTYLPVVRELVAEGFLHPAPGGPATTYRPSH